MKTTLKLEVKDYNGSTNISDCYFTAPLKIGIPKSEDDRFHVIFMMASAGLLKDDEYHYEITCKQNSKLLITDQSYSKIFDTGDGLAFKNVLIHIEENASVYYMPSAVIPFKGSTFEGITEIRMQNSSKCIYSEIFCVGRVGMNERFQFKKYKNRLKIYIDNRFVFLDHICFEPSNTKLDNLIYFGNFTHMGMMFYYGDESVIEEIENFTSEFHVMIGITRPVMGILIRVLAHSAQDIEEIFQTIKKRIEFPKGCTISRMQKFLVL